MDNWPLICYIPVFNNNYPILFSNKVDMNKEQLIEWKDLRNRGDGGWTTKQTA